MCVILLFTNHESQNTHACTPPPSASKTRHNNNQQLALSFYFCFWKREFNDFCVFVFVTTLVIMIIIMIIIITLFNDDKSLSLIYILYTDLFLQYFTPIYRFVQDPSIPPRPEQGRHFPLPPKWARHRIRERTLPVLLKQVCKSAPVTVPPVCNKSYC